MGYREWRERQIAKLDAKADALDASAERMNAKLTAEKAERDAVRAEAKVDGDLAWCRAEAARNGVDHDEMVERAAVLGLGVPGPRQARGLERVAERLDAATAVLPGSSLVRGFAAVGMAADGGMDASGGERPDPYRAWVTLIRTEERVGSAGDGASKADRALLRMARWAYKRSQ